METFNGENSDGEREGYDECPLHDLWESDDDIPLVQPRKEEKLADHSSPRNNASEEQPLSQCWGPPNVVALSDIWLKDKLHHE